MGTLFLHPDITPVEFDAGDTLAELEEQDKLDVPFGCYDGHCAACMVQILEGVELLNAPTPVEHYTLTKQEIADNIRLACRVTLCQHAGTVRLKVYF